MQDKTQEKRRKLYDGLVAAGYDAGKDYADFDSLMNTDEVARKWVFDTAQSEGWKVGNDFAEFEGFINPAPQRAFVEGSVYSKEQGDYSQPSQAQREYESRGGFEPIGQGKVKLGETETPVFVGGNGEWRVPSPVMLNKEEEMFRHGNPSESEKSEFVRKAKAQLKKETTQGIDSLDETISDKLLAKRREINSNYKAIPVTGVAGGMLGMSQADIVAQSDKEMTTLQAAYNLVQDSKKQVERYNRQDDGFGINTLRSAGEAAIDPSTWDFGLTDMKDSSALLNVVNKEEKGEKLTDAEQLLLDASVNNALIQAYYKAQSMGELAGSGAVNMIPFMAQILLNPLSGLGRKASSAAAKGVAKYINKKIVSKGLLANAVKKVAPRASALAVGLPADMAAGVGMAVTTNAMRTAADANERQLRGEKPGEAWRDAVLNQGIEFASENTGRFFNPLFSGIGKVVGAGAAKVAPKSVVNLAKDISKKGYSRQMKDFFKNTQWDGFLEEYAEEIAGGLMNAAYVGDMSVDKVFSKDNLLETAAGLSVASVLFPTMGTINYGVQKVKQRKRVAAAEAEAERVFGKRWPAFYEAINSAETDDELRTNIAEVYHRENRQDVTKDELQALYDYVAPLFAYRAIRDMSPSSVADMLADDVYSTAYAQDISPKLANESFKAWENAGKEVTAILGLKDQSVEDWLGGRTVEEAANGDKAVLDALTAYKAAKADFEGRRDRYQQDKQRAYSESDKAIDKMANNGIVYTTQLDGQPVNITGGNVVLNGNGTVDYENSSAGLYLTMPDGSVRVIASEKIPGVVLAENAEELKAAERAKIDNKWKVEFDAAEMAEQTATPSDQVSGDVARVFINGQEVGMPHEWLAEARVQPTQTAQPVAPTANNFTFEDNGTTNAVEVLDESGVKAKVLVNGHEVEWDKETLADARAAAGVEAQPVEVAEQEKSSSPKGETKLYDFFRMDGKNYSVVSRNEDGSVNVVVEGKRAVLPADTDFSAAVPTNNKGEVQFTELPVEQTLDYFKQRVANEKARTKMIDENRKSAERERAKFDKEPNVGKDPDAYASIMKRWEEDKAAAQAKVDYWNRVAELNAPAEAVAEMENTTETVAEEVKPTESVEAPAVDVEEVQATNEMQPVEEQGGEEAMPLVDNQGEVTDAQDKYMPYPFDTDADWMDEAFGNLFEVMQERETEDGNVALYQRGSLSLDTENPAFEAATKNTIEAVKKAGVEVVEATPEMVQAVNELAEMQKRTAPETAVRQNAGHSTVVSSADGAKVLKDLDSAIAEYENKPSNRQKTFIGDLSRALKLRNNGNNSNYGTFTTVNGETMELRVSDHNVSTKNMADAGKNEGISIVITHKPNKGITNDGNAHIVEFYYNTQKLQKEIGQPYVEILKSIKQALYSGEYKDNTGLAQREEVNIPDFLRTSDGTIYGWAVNGKIYLTPEGMNPNTPAHEYTHLWAAMVEKNNPKLWSRIVEAMKESPMWNEVLLDEAYRDIHNNDSRMASEVLSRLSGEENYRRAMERAKQEIKAADGIIEKAKKIALWGRIKQALADFWTSVKSVFGLTEKAPWTEFVNMALGDLYAGVNPGVNESPLEKMFIGEKGATNLDKAEEATTRLDNLNVAREMEEAEKDAKTIKLATGWERGADGKWRYEVVEMVDVDAVENLAREAKSQSILAPALKTNLSSILKPSDSLLKSYPQLSNMTVVFRPMKAYNGYYDEKTNTLAISTSVLNKESEASEALDKAKTSLENWETMDDARKEFTKQLGIDYNAELEKLKNNVLELEKAQSEVSSLIANELNETVAHEIQHAVQNVEGFAKGGDYNSGRLYEYMTSDMMVKKLIALRGKIEKEFYSTEVGRQVEQEEDTWFENNPDFTDEQAKEHAEELKAIYPEYAVFLKRLAELPSIEKELRKPKSKIEAYRRLSGEVESRNVQSRLGMTEEERRNSLAAETEDVAREDQIFLYDNLGVSASEVAVEEGKETIDDIPTRPMTLMERVKASLLEASAKNKKNLKLRRDALRNLGQDLANITKLMRAQRTYDKSTVETLMTIAKMYFKDAQLLDKLSAYEVTRIMGVLKRSVGKQDIESEAMKLMDILLDAHNKALAEVLEKTEKVKAKKVNAAGVEVMGRLDKYGQELVETYREAKDLSSELLDERIAESSNNLAEADENVRAALGLTEADDVDAVVKDFVSTDKAKSDAVDAYMRERARYEGFVLAKEYRDGVLECKAGIAELKRDIENAKSEYKQGRMNGKALSEFTKVAQEGILELKAEMAEGYHSVIGALAHDVRESSLRAKAFVQAQIDRAQEIQHDANSDMQGRNADVQGTHPDKWNNSAVRAVMSAMPTFQTMLKKFGEQAVDGKGYLYNRFMPQVTMAADNEFRGRVAAREAIEAKLKDIYGDKKMDISRFMDLSRKDGVSVMYIEGKEMKEFKLTKGQMLYIYMVDKMTDGEMKLRKMGITEDAVAEIAKNLDEQMIQFADWMQGEFLSDLRAKYNAVHERMFGAPMAAIENYFPLKIKKEARGEKGDVSQQNSEDKPSTVTGSIIKRTKNTTALDLSADAMSVLLEHIDNMEHWAAFAEFNRDLNTLLNYRRFQNQVKNMTTLRYGSGDVLWRNFKDVAAVAAGEFRPTKSEFDKALLNIAKGVTASKINFRFYTAAKQILSAPAFWTGAAPQYFAKCYTNPKGSWEWAIDNLPGFKERWESRAMGNEKLLEDESDWKVWRNKFVAGATRWGMSANAAVDALTVAMGARAVYLDKYNELKKAGYSEQKADEKARQTAAEAYNESQQSSESAYLSPLQKSGTAASAVFTTFKNSNFGYTRKTAQAIANIVRKTKGDKEKTIAFMAKQMARDGLTPAQAKAYATKLYNRSLWKDYADAALFGFGLQLLWELGGAAIYLIGGDDDEKKDAMMQEAAVRATMGTLQGLPLGETVANAVMAVMAGDAEKFRLPELVAVGDIRNVAQAMDTDAVRGATEVVNMLTSIGIGVTPQVLTDILVACKELGKSPEEFGTFLLRFMNAPQSQLEALTIDKAMEEFAKNSAEVGKEYAEYRMDKNVPYFQWLYSDEGEQKAIERYAKRFDKLLDERLDFVVEDATAYDLFYDGAQPGTKKVLSEKRQDYLAGDEAAEFVKRDTKAIVEETLYGKREINTVYFEMSTAEDEDMEFLIKKARKNLEGKADATVAQKSLLKSINSYNNAINKLKRAMQTDPTNKVKYMERIRAIRTKLVDLINNSNE